MELRSCMKKNGTKEAKSSISGQSHEMVPVPKQGGTDTT